MRFAAVRGSSFKWLLVSLLTGAALAAACSNAADSAVGTAPSSPTDPSGTGAPGEKPVVRAEFGLDARPANPTCVAPPRPPAAASVKLEPVFPGLALREAMAMAQIPGDGSRWFVAQRAGQIVSFPVASPPTSPAVVADVAALAGKPVISETEGGLLNLAFHPKFTESGRLFVSFTTTGNPWASEVGYLTSTDGGSSFTSYTQVLRFDRPTLYHCGGGLAFGKDGLLYLSFGDAGRDNNGQRVDGFLAKVLRIDVDNVPGGQTYGIPDGNPFKNGGGEPATFARGFRNPFRLSVDRSTGDVWVGDVGDATAEEVNRVQLGGNYGWPCKEGLHDHTPVGSSCPTKSGLVDPVYSYDHVPVGSRGSISGGIVYRGKAMPAFHGSYVYGDYATLEGRALVFDPATSGVKSVWITEDGPHKTYTSFAEDQDGEIYASTIYQSEIFKLVPTAQEATSAFPDRLSKTGCVDPADPKKPASGLVPYGVNAELWSDGATKDRWVALPDGKAITVGADGDLDLPIGSVVVKNFALAGKRIETRLLVRHDDGEWAGYSYEWIAEQTDAVLLPSGKTAPAGEQIWTFPSRSECTQCHTGAAGRTLGLELAQLNGDFVYKSTGHLSNQLKTFDHIGLFAAPLGKPPAELAAYPAPFGDAPLDARAKSYLHANCSMCHRPEGGAGRAEIDFRFGTSLADSKTCRVASGIDDLGVAGGALLTPGDPQRSLMSLRMHATNVKRMPPLGTRIVDEAGSRLIDDWIRGAQCP
jgi:uncharacterized repeat protein (TIGR03806 family)